MSSKEVLPTNNEDDIKEEENCTEEQENENLVYQEDNCESDNINSPVNISDNKGPEEHAVGLEAVEVSRGGISVIASTAEAEAYLYPGVTASTDPSFALVTEVESTSATHLVLEHNSEQVEPLYSEDSVVLKNEDQESTVESIESDTDTVETKNDVDVVKSIPEDGFQSGDISISEVYAEEDEAVICNDEEEFAVIGETEEEEAVIGDAEEDEEAAVGAAEEEVVMGEDEEEAVEGDAEDEEIVTGDAEEEVVADDTAGQSIVTENEELVQLEMKSETEEISYAEVADVMRQDAGSIEGLEDYEQVDYQEGSITQDCNTEGEESQPEEVDTDNPHEEIEEEVTVDHQPENQILMQEAINSSSVVETECQDDSVVVEGGEDESNAVKDNDGDFAGDGEMEDDGEGEEFGGEEEEFEDGEEMGDEVEVEIEDCSDSEMEPEGGITYIISEGMIVVEENEGSDSFQPADIADVTEEEHIVCEDQLGKTTRIVIKVPSSSSKSTNDTESGVSPDHSSVSETEGIAVSILPENCSSANSSNVSMSELEQKSDSLLSSSAVSNETSTHDDVTLNQIDNSVQKLPEVECFHSAVNDASNLAKSDVQEDSTVSTQGTDGSEMTKESGSEENAEATISKGEQGESVESSSVCDKTETQQSKIAAAAEVILSVEPVKEDSSKETEAGINMKDGDISGIHNGGNTEPIDAVLLAANESGAVKQAIKPDKTLKTSEEPPKSEKALKESRTVAASSGNSKPSEKSVTKSSTKNETKGPKTVSHCKNLSTQEKNHTESSKEKQSTTNSDSSRHSSKHTHSSPHKHKNQSNKLSADEKSLSVAKSSSKHEHIPKDEKGSKTDSMKKQTETKDSPSRASHNDGHHSSKGSSSHRTRSNSTSSKESSGKDRRSSRKDDPSSKVSNITTATSDASTTSKSSSESKIALRSSRSRKSQPEPLSMASNAEDVVQTKKDKSKTTETPVKPRHSERVSKATEKAIASGLRRSKPINADNCEKPHDTSSEDHASQRRSKRKAELSPISKEEVPLNKRRTTRSGEAQLSEEVQATSSQSLRSIRKSKSLKRRGSTSDLPPAKHAHQEDISPKEKITEEFVANLPKMCRICGSKNDNLLNVFGPEGRTMQLPEKVHSILPIKIREDEPLPSGVCHSCVVTLIACEKLVEKCSSIDKRLRAHFNCPVEKLAKAADAHSVEESSSISLPKSEKSIESGPIPPQPSTKPAETPARGHDEASAPNIKSAPSTRSSARVSAKNKLAETANKTTDIKPKSASKSLAQEEIPAAKKASVAPNSESEDSPPVLEAEPPQSHLPASNQEPSAQPPVLVPQPGKPVPELVPIPADEASNASKQRFGNTYRARMKPGQWEKIERGLEAIHGELQEDDEQEEGLSDVKPFAGNITEEFHIVDLDMNVEEVPQGVPLEKAAPSVSSEFHVEIPEEMPDEDATAQQSSPKSVIDSILVDWSGDEDEVVVPQKANVASSGRKIVCGGASKDNINGSAPIKQASSSSKTPCLFGDDEEGDGTSRVKTKTATPTAAPTSVIVKQESFWPEPAPGSSTTSSEKPPSDVPWKCFVCGKRGKSLSKFLEHKKLHLNDRKLVSCPKCSESFSNMGLLKAHMKAHHGDDDEDDVVELQPRQTRRKTARQEKVVDVDLAPATDGLYHCSLCLSAFTNIESLCQHKLTHSKADSSDGHKCTACRKTFSQQKELQQHMATHHQSTSQNLALFQCAKCDMKMSNQKEFIEHIESHSTGQQNFTCDLCNKVFDTKHKLRSHRSTVHKSTAYACHLCDKVCQKRITLIEHLRKHTGDNPFACPVCNKRFNRLANYKAHMTIHENARRYECPYCGKRFNRQSIQQRHIKTHTSEQSRKHRCRVCNLTFGLATEMFTHRKLHTREEVERATWEDEKQRLALTSFPCKVCQASFNTVEDVLAHMPAHTDDERDIAAKLKNPRLECDICGKVLNSKRTFNAHRSSHIDGKPFVCKICSKGYSTSTGLNYHMLSHTGERPFPCTFCQKGYKNSTDLKVHMRQHTGEFPYKCNLCNKAFRSASSLQKHGFVHTNHRPFKCQFCNMSFKRENTKLNHERIHTNDRRFKCKVCSRSFIQKGACDAHEKLHFRGGTLSYLPGEGPVGQAFEENSASTSAKADKHDLFEDFEEEDFDEDDDDEDEYIIYEDEDGIDDEEVEEEEITGDLQDDMKNLTKGVFEEASKSSNGVDLPVTTITPVPISMTNDVVPSVGDTSVHITIL